MFFEHTFEFFCYIEQLGSFGRGCVFVEGLGLTCKAAFAPQIVETRPDICDEFVAFFDSFDYGGLQHHNGLDFGVLWTYFSDFVL